MADEQTNQPAQEQKPPTPPPPPKSDEQVRAFISQGGREGAKQDFDTIIKRAASQAEQPKND